MRVVENFFDDFAMLRATLDVCEYRGMVNPVDGVEYPGICGMFPFPTYCEMIYKAGKAVGSPVISSLSFFRLSILGEKPPHQAHNDATMGDWTMLVYMSRPEHCQGGTSLVSHKETGLCGAVKTKEEEEIWRRDTNIYDAWDVLAEVKMVPNRAVIFPSDCMHRAEPVQGFGSSAYDGRLVLCSFFSTANDQKRRAH